MAERYKKANFVELGNFILPVLKDIGLDQNFFFRNLNNDWENIVGRTNALHTKPESLENDVLTVSVSSPVWITQARFLKNSFLEKINGFETKNGFIIKDIKFVLGKNMTGA